MKNKQLINLVLLILLSSFQTIFSQTVNQSGTEIANHQSDYNNTSFGENVFVFDPAMNMKEVQTLIDTLFKRQALAKSEFNKNRYALLFKPGTYNLDIQVGYYMQISGLGASPEDVIIIGAVRSNTTHHNSVLTNFWRSVENITIVPTTDSTVVWGVSQAAPMRRVHIKGNLNLFDKGYASGGFLADSKIDGVVSSGPQQQWLSRNTEWGKWIGGNWNMMFIGVHGAPAENWPENPYTVIEKTPVIREKPYITFDKKGFTIKVPQLEKSSSGATWTNPSRIDKSVSLKDFYIVRAGKDNSESINSALKKGKNLLFTPGIYLLDKTLRVTRKGTIIIGMGFPSLMPVNGNSAIELSDVDGITVSGITIDAGPLKSDYLFVAGEKGSIKSHEADPSFLYDIFFRVGGPAEGSTSSCMVINSKNVVVDHTWLWRADHGNGVGWDKNRCANGLIVNGDDVTIYGLFNEHFQEYQTLWNGNNGKVYFYQSEMPYDPPSVDSWKHGNTFGYASYKVSDKVMTHEAWGIGIYNVFYDAPVIVDNAIETPPAIEDKIHNKIIFWLNGNKESVVKSIINGKGGEINVSNRKAAIK
jgi:predicted heme/steroid binding protein